MGKTKHCSNSKTVKNKQFYNYKTLKKEDKMAVKKSAAAASEIKSAAKNITMSDLALKVIKEGNLSKKSVWIDIFKAINIIVTDIIIPTIEGGFNWNTYQTLIKTIFYYLSKL
jgi:hypothetical protein